MKKKKKEINVWRILGYLIYYEKKYQEEVKSFNNTKENKNDKSNDAINNNDINKKNNLINIGDVNNNNDSNNTNESDINIYEPPCCYSCRLGFRKYRHKADTLFTHLFCISFQFFYQCFFYCCCICCCCGIEEYKNYFCDESDLSEVNQGDEQFCFCYKVQGKYSWFWDLLFKNDILT